MPDTFNGFAIVTNEYGTYNVPTINCFSTPTLDSAKRAIERYAAVNGLDATGRVICRAVFYSAAGAVVSAQQVASVCDALEMAYRWNADETREHMTVRSVDVNGTSYAVHVQGVLL